MIAQTIRLREMYIERSLRHEQCAVTVAETAAPLRTAAASMLELAARSFARKRAASHPTAPAPAAERR